MMRKNFPFHEKRDIMSEQIRYTCGDCDYCRFDDNEGIFYCRQTFAEINMDSTACDSFEEVD